MCDLRSHRDLLETLDSLGCIEFTLQRPDKNKPGSSGHAHKSSFVIRADEMPLPMLTEAAPKVSAEGSIVPLGMYGIADVLAVHMIPGVREYQTHPGFLISISVSLSICSEFDEDIVAADGINEPWQVFGWYFVEGMVHSTKDSKLLRRLLGQHGDGRGLQS